MFDLLYAGTCSRSHSSNMLSKATHLTLRHPGWNGMQLSRGQHLRAPAAADHHHLCTAEAHLPCTGRLQLTITTCAQLKLTCPAQAASS